MIFKWLYYNDYVNVVHNQCQSSEVRSHNIKGVTCTKK